FNNPPNREKSSIFYHRCSLLWEHDSPLNKHAVFQPVGFPSFNSATVGTLIMVVLPPLINHFHGRVAIGAVRIKRFRGAFAGTTPPVWIAEIFLLVNLAW